MKRHQTYNENDQTFYDLTVKGERFERVPKIEYSTCNRAECKHYHECCSYETVVRTFDCIKNAKIANMVYNIVTGIIVYFATLHCYKELQLGSFKATVAVIVFLVAFDIVCCIGEKLVDVFRENHLYKKLKKVQIKTEAKEVFDEIKENNADPNRIRIRKAETFINTLKGLVTSVDFGKSKEKVDTCVSKLSEIVEHLKNDSSSYIRVAYILESYLPEFCKILQTYANLKNVDTATEEYDEILTSSVDKFYNFLQEQRIEDILEKQSDEIKFRMAAKTLSDMIGEGEK